MKLKLKQKQKQKQKQKLWSPPLVVSYLTDPRASSEKIQSLSVH